MAYVNNKKSKSARFFSKRNAQRADRQKYFLKNRWLPERKKSHLAAHTGHEHQVRTSGHRTCGHEHRARTSGHRTPNTHIGHEHRARTHRAIHLTIAHVGTLRPTLWQLCAQAFPVKACMRAGRAGASGMGAFKLHDQGGSSRVAGRHETGMVLASFCQCAAVQGSTGHGRYTCWHIYFVKNENDNHSEKF